MSDHPLISFDEIREGDCISSVEIDGDFTLTRRGHAFIKHGDRWYTTGDRFLGNKGLTFQLVERKKGPAHDAKFSEIFRDPQNGSLWARAEGSAIDGQPYFVGLSDGHRGTTALVSVVDRLEPFSTPQQARRQDVIDAAIPFEQEWSNRPGGISYATGTGLALAVRALRQHEEAER